MWHPVCVFLPLWLPGRYSSLASTGTSAPLPKRVNVTAHADALRPDDLLHASPWLVVRFRPADLRVTFVTDNAGWILGYSAAELTGSRAFWDEVAHPDDGPRCLARVRQAAADVVAQLELECRLRAKDGHYRAFSILLRIEYEDDGQPASMIGYVQDIADRKAAEADARQAHAFSDVIVEHLPAMVFVKEAGDLRYVQFNRGAEALLGMMREEVLGRTDSDLFPAELARVYEARDREVLRARRLEDVGEDVMPVRNGEPRIVHTKKIPIFGESGEPAYLLGISQDITERRAAHEEVRIARLEAERASRAKSDFLSRMSHDLRTPLNAILGFAQILQMERLGAEHEESVQQILRAGSHLLALINEVLDIARIEAGQLSLSPEPVAVADVLAQVAALVRPLAAHRGIVVSADVAGRGALYVHADRQRLQQVLINLVSNAVKYNRDGGTVGVSCEPHAGTVVIRVTDTGPGIRPDRLQLLFQPFERLGAEQSAIEGTGLGLAVSKGLTEAMGGRVGVHSRVDQGSTFWIELPGAEAPSPQAVAPSLAAPPPVAAAAGTVVYVEDNRSNVRLLERLLARRAGLRLISAGTGQSALDAVRSVRPDLVLLDLHLPDMSGEEVLRRLWADPETRRIPVAVLSADATANQKQRLRAAGAIDYLTKPLDLARLLELIDRQLGPGGAEPAAETRGER